MLNIGPGELLAVCVIALIVLGPDKLPQALHTLGRVSAELRRVSTGFQNEIQNAMDNAVRDDWEDDSRDPGGERRGTGAVEASLPSSPGSNGSDMAGDQAEPEEDVPHDDDRRAGS